MANNTLKGLCADFIMGKEISKTKDNYWAWRNLDTVPSDDGT